MYLTPFFLHYIVPFATPPSTTGTHVLLDMCTPGEKIVHSSYADDEADVILNANDGMQYPIHSYYLKASR
jgi:hypothetical protein